MHFTDTVDYMICFFGMIDLVLDDETVTMVSGFILIQCVTNHAWINRGTTPARLACILIDAEPNALAPSAR